MGVEEVQEQVMARLGFSLLDGRELGRTNVSFVFPCFAQGWMEFE